MDDKEKVLKGVRLHFDKSIECSPDCPYGPCKDRGCVRKVAADIEALIKGTPDNAFHRLVVEEGEVE